MAHAALDPAPAAPVLAVCGWSGSGKTTVLEAAIPHLARRGLAIAVVKHDAHGVQVDHPGKDSDRLFRAGADVVLSAPEETLVRRRPTASHELRPALDILAEDHDLILVEGHKGTVLPKLWLAGTDGQAPPEGVGEVLAVLGGGDDHVAALLASVDELLARHHEGRQRVGGVLVGGRSVRMGRPKQLVEHAGRSLLGSAVEALAAHHGEVVLLGGGEVPAAAGQLRRLPDPPGLHGPVAGLAAALRWAPGVAWTITSCDLPLVVPATIAWLLGQRRPGAWAVLPVGPGGRVEPLLAVYEPQSRRLVERLVAGGDRAPRLLAAHPKVRTVEIPAELVGTFRGVNTPADLRAL